jgi:hypothetical protein
VSKVGSLLHNVMAKLGLVASSWFIDIIIDDARNHKCEIHCETFYLSLLPCALSVCEYWKTHKCIGGLFYDILRNEIVVSNVDCYMLMKNEVVVAYY